MKKYLLFSGILLCCFFRSLAQEPAREPAKEELSAEERSKMFVDHISPKLNLTKGQKDSLTIIFVQFMDDIQKYHAENNAKVITFMMKTRDDKVRNLLRDSLRFDKYLMVMEDIKKQRTPDRAPAQSPPQGGQHHNMGGGMGGGMGSGQPY